MTGKFVSIIKRKGGYDVKYYTGHNIGEFEYHDDGFGHPKEKDTGKLMLCEK